MNFCSHCGQKVHFRVPADDTRERHICDDCGTIHYENPRNVVGTIPVWDNKILLCKRAIDPRLGYWTLPAGFLEIGESTSAGASRETFEEAGAVVEVGGLFSLLNVPHIGQVHMFYLAQMSSADFSAGVESLEVDLFDEKDIPWDELAFPTVVQTLKWFFEDRASGRLNESQRFKPHHLDLTPRR